MHHNSRRAENPALHKMQEKAGSLQIYEYIISFTMSMKYGKPHWKSRSGRVAAALPDKYLGYHWGEDLWNYYNNVMYTLST